MSRHGHWRLRNPVVLMLTSVRPDQCIELGVGLGIPRGDGGGCHLSQSVSAVSGSATQLSANVDAGTYCVKVFDLGTLANEVSFSITIVHPWRFGFARENENGREADRRLANRLTRLSESLRFGASSWSIGSTGEDLGHHGVAACVD